MPNSMQVRRVRLAMAAQAARSAPGSADTDSGGCWMTRKTAYVLLVGFTLTAATLMVAAPTEKRNLVIGHYQCQRFRSVGCLLERDPIIRSLEDYAGVVAAALTRKWSLTTLQVCRLEGREALC